MKIHGSHLFLFFLLLGFYISVDAQTNCKPCNFPSGRFLVDVFPSDDISRTSDIVYSDSLSINPRKMDLYGFNDSCKARPLVIYLPGSGFIDLGINPKNSDVANSKALYFAQKGYAVAVVDYYRVPEPYTSASKFNGVMHEAMKDVYSSIQFLIGMSETFRIDTNNIFIIGESAGGIAGLGAIFSNVDGKFISEEIPSMISTDNIALNVESLYPNSRVSIKGFAGISTSLPTVSFFQSKVNNVNLPMLFIHSNKDSIVPFNSGTPNFFEGALIKPLCGPKCLNENKIQFKGSNCIQLNEINDFKHDVLSRPIGVQYLVEMRNFFYDQLNCYGCKSYHNVYDPNITDSLGIEFPVEELSEVAIYPNPASNYIIIKGLVSLEVSNIKIFSISGQYIEEYVTTNAVQWVDIKRFNSGIYIVKISTDEKSVTQKFAKQ